MYLQLTSAYYTHNTIISQGEKELGLFEEMDKFAKNMIEIYEGISSVCPFFHGPVTLEKGHLFKPGAKF